MRLSLTGRNVEVTPALRQQVSRQIQKLERLAGDMAVSAQVVLARERFRCLTTVTLHARGDRVLTGLGDATTWLASIKEACESLEKQTRKVKEKWTTRKRRATGGKRLPVPPEAAGAAPPLDAATLGPRIIRARHLVRSLSLDAARARLAKSSDEFLVFRNSETGRTAVLVRRQDGNFGLIEPEA